MMNVKFPFAGAVAVGLSFAAVSGETYTYVGGAPSAVGNSAYENAKWWKNSAGVVGKDGDPLDPNGDYISAVAMNTPNSGNAAYGASGISHSVANTHLVIIAIYNAIGKWVDPPATPDKVLKALGKA